MDKTSNLWEKLRYQLTQNFPNADKGKIENMLTSLKNTPYKDEELELYLPALRGIVLRVGITVKADHRVRSYFSTDAEKELWKVIEI